MPREDHFQDITVAGVVSLGAQSKIEGNLTPDTDDNRDLGAADKRWRTIYLVNQPNITDLDVNTLDFDNTNKDVRLSRASANVLQLATGDSFLPESTGQDLGSTVKRWDVFAGDLDASGTVTGLVTPSRAINTTSPLSGGGDLSADRAIALANQNANIVLAGPSSGGAAAPTFRALVNDDIPDTISLDNITQITNRAISDTSGTLAISRGGTGQTTQTAAFDALDPLTTKGDVLANDGTNSIRLAVGSNGQVLTADSAQASGVKWDTAAGYVLQARAAGLNPVDATTYFFGSAFSRSPETDTDARKRIPIPLAGNITRLDVVVTVLGTLATTETITFVVRLNNTSDSHSLTIKADALVQTASATGSVAVVAGDYFEIKLTTPTWATNPTVVEWHASALIE